ncbi:MAG: AAA family ATPase [Candidatus Nitrosocaldaceae archaeon]
MELEELVYLDWNKSLDILKKAYEADLFVLIIGPKGTGKTTMVRKFAEMVNKELITVNFSLRTRESHLIGTQTFTDKVDFVEGILVRSMRKGELLYLDELNAAEADVLLRLDEALDERRQLVLKEAGGEIIKAHNDWFVIATINPLSHVGTKELPPQLLSRFPVRIRITYPPPDVEFEIIKLHTKVDDKNVVHVKNAIKLANRLRDAATVEELYYGPSIRESIAFAKMIAEGVEPKVAAESIFANVYEQWGEADYRKVMDLLTSIFG